MTKTTVHKPTLDAKQYERALVVVAPYLRGQRVKDAQWLMQGNTRFGEKLAPYKDGRLDGVYGPASGRATKQLKFWLGYPLSACNTSFGQTLYEYVRPNKWRPLPPEYRRRRTQRLRAAASTPGEKAMEFLAQYIGYKETPVNWTMFGRWFGLDGNPWCAMFESYGFAHTGRASFHYAAVFNIVQDARAYRNGLREVWTPRRGDLACFRIHGDPYAHTSFFDRWVDEQAGTFIDLGGNTGPSNISNGGMVMRQERTRSMVSHFVRVG